MYRPVRALSLAGSVAAICLGPPDGEAAQPGPLVSNEGGARFTEIGRLAGVAYGQDGQQEAGMGVDAADYDNDGDMDLVVTNFENEPNGLYQNRGTGFFPYASFPAGIALISLRYLSFGIGFIDYDNDGYQDLFVANGHVLDNTSEFNKSSSYAQPNQLLRNQGPGRPEIRSVRHAGRGRGGTTRPTARALKNQIGDMFEIPNGRKGL